MMRQSFFLLFLIIFLSTSSVAQQSMEDAQEKNEILNILPLILAGAKHTDKGDPWWQPAPGTTWQIQFTGKIDRTVEAEMYEVDLHTISKEEISLLHEDGRVVICAFGGGAWEEFRPDSHLYPESILGNNYNGWAGERWVDIRRIEILGPILQGRMDLAVSKGCDGIEVDNVNSYTHDTGFPITYENQLTFNKWLANQAHARYLSIGLKNDLLQVKELVDYFDWALNESCFHYSTGSEPECVYLLPFIKAGKAVFSIEYIHDINDYCAKAKAYGLSYIKKNWSLDAWRQTCP